MTKKIIAIVMAVAIIASLLAACGNSDNNNNNNTNSSSEADSGADSAASSQADGENSISGTGNNDTAVLSMTLFDVEYTLGKSKVKDLVDHDWGYDPDSWKDVDMDKKIEYKQDGEYSKKMDNNTTEITISYDNLAETYAAPADCVLTQIDFDGETDGAIAKAGVKILGGKVDLTTCTTTEKFETALNSVLSTYSKEDSDYSTFVSSSYKFELKNGNGYIHTQVDKEKNTITKFSVMLHYDKYAEEEEDSSDSSEKPSGVYFPKSEKMWDDSEKITGSGDSADLANMISIFDKDYTIGKVFLKQMTEDGWGMDTDTWKNVDLERSIEYKKGYSNKELHNNTAEAEIDIGNLASVSAVPADCLVTSIEINGAPDGVFTKADVKLCDGKIEISKLTSASDLEDALKEAASWYEKKSGSDTYYSYHFLTNDGKGSVVMNVSLDKDKKISKYDVKMTLTDQFTYEAD